VFAYRSEIDDWLRDTEARSNDESARHTENGRSKPKRWAVTSLVVGVGLLVIASLVVFALRTHKLSEGRLGAPADDKLPKPLIEPVISSVTRILPRPDQTIIIKGSDFGWYSPFNSLDTPFLAIRDITGHWAAGRIIDRNPDDVTLSVSSWTDSEIVITGLSGAYGQNGWKLIPGDEIDVAVWNPQTGAGPAIYRLICGRP
jgi:hypothetical protein